MVNHESAIEEGRFIKVVVKELTNVFIRYPFLGIMILFALGMAVVPTVYSTSIAYPSFVELLVENTENESVRVALHLTNVLDLGEGESLVTPKFIEDVREAMHDFQLMKLKLFSASGEVLYSTAAKDIGVVNKKRYFHEIVAKGEVFTIVVEKNSMSLEDQIVTLDVVETYVPIVVDNTFRGAVEIYYNITDRKATLEALLVKLTLTLIIVVALLLLIGAFNFVKLVQNILGREKAERALNRYYKKIKAQQTLIENQLDRARETQKSLFPEHLPNFPKTKLARKYLPIEKIGGDFYDLFELSSGKLGLIIGDVTGHGISAALLSFMVAGTTKNSVHGIDSTRKVMNTVNEFLEGKMPAGTYSTLFYGIFDPESRSLTYTSAGHPPGLIIRSHTREVIPLMSESPPVGILSNGVTQYKEDQFQLQPRDKLMLYSDAIFELKDNEQNLLSMDRFWQILLELCEEPIESMLEKLYDHILSSTNNATYDDDLTLVGLEVL